MQKTFDEIAEELGVSKQRAKQIYDSAIKKAAENMKNNGFTIEDVVEELGGHKTLFEAMEYGVAIDFEPEEDLRGFWKEENV